MNTSNVTKNVLVALSLEILVDNIHGKIVMKNPVEMVRNLENRYFDDERIRKISFLLIRFSIKVYSIIEMNY